MFVMTSQKHDGMHAETKAAPTKAPDVACLQRRLVMQSKAGCAMGRLGSIAREPDLAACPVMSRFGSAAACLCLRRKSPAMTREHR